MKVDYDTFLEILENKMMPLENPWIRRAKWLTQALIISGTLNIGLLATFFYFVLKEKQEVFSLRVQPSTSLPAETNEKLLCAYSSLPSSELLLRLENKEPLEEGLTKRDLALACLVHFHHFNLEKALGGLALQQRHILVHHTEGQETIDLPLFVGLADVQFQAILQYARTEQWPLTTQGLFYEIKRSSLPRDPSLLQTFYLTSEFHAISTLFAKTGLSLSKETLIDLLSEGEWKQIADFISLQRQSFDLSPDRRRALLLSYHTPRAASLLLQTDLEFILKRLSDAEILSLLDLIIEKTPEAESCAKGLLTSVRTDAVWKRAAELLYTFAGEPLPEPYSHAHTLARFFPPQTPPPLLAQTKEAIKVSVPKKIHIVEPGESLWKISRKYRVNVDEIMRVNHLETDKLRPGKKLEIPEKTPLQK